MCGVDSLAMETNISMVLPMHKHVLHSKYKYSLLMHRIIFFWMNKTFWGCIYHFSISLTLVVLQWQKSLPDIGGTTIQEVGHLESCGLPWSLASTPWAMSLYFKFRAIYFWHLNEYKWWHQAKIYHIIRQLSYRFMCEIMTWSDDKSKLIHKNISARLRLWALEPQVKRKFPSQ